MKCIICDIGETEPGMTTVTLQRDGTIIVFKNVPADVCQVCGEAYTEDIFRPYQTPQQAVRRLDHVIDAYPGSRTCLVISNRDGSAWERETVALVMANSVSTSVHLLLFAYNTL